MKYSRLVVFVNATNFNKTSRLWLGKWKNCSIIHCMKRNHNFVKCKLLILAFNSKPRLKCLVWDWTTITTNEEKSSWLYFAVLATESFAPPADGPERELMSNKCIKKVCLNGFIVGVECVCVCVCLLRVKTFVTAHSNQRANNAKIIKTVQMQKYNTFVFANRESLLATT